MNIYGPHRVEVALSPQVSLLLRLPYQCHWAPSHLPVDSLASLPDPSCLINTIWLCFPLHPVVQCNSSNVNLILFYFS